MRERCPGPVRPASLVAVGALVALVAPLTWSSPVGATEADETTSAGESIVVEGPVRFVAATGDTLRLDDGLRYLDTLELRPAGSVVVNELSLEDYVAGIAEMPARWPMEALKAQAVAARTYAWWTAQRDTYDGYDICATTACQVFRGAEVVREDGGRWREAVDDTAGEVLLDADGAPVLARYFSTSGGRTYANEDVFPSTGAFEHLIAIEDPDDAVSPYHRWQVRFSRQEFDTLLARGETLAAAVPVAEVARLGPVERHDADLAVTGTDGTRVEVSALALRDFISRFAPDLDGERFPPLRADGARRLPTTVPSTRFEISVRDDEVVIDGQGWGHGVGMGQYGAQGRAARGEPYDSILASYYNGLMPRVSDELPERIRVGIEVGSEVSIAGDGAVRIETAAGEALAAGALGTWRAARVDGVWTLTPPPGTDQELAVVATEATGPLGASLTFETEVNKPVLLRLEVRDDAGRLVAVRELGAVDPGRHAASWARTDDDGRPVPAGDYSVMLVGEDAAGASDGSPVDVRLDGGDDTAAAAPAPNADDERTIPLALILVLAMVGLGLSLVLITITRKDDA
ncbi:MAG: SpoIID/LytB domain-containing protein [Nitriliruptoraceae bacterium]|nr:SpoIID/LytB domain-containing protein [Nitriliruptoraceae bacterium]